MMERSVKVINKKSKRKKRMMHIAMILTAVLSLNIIFPSIGGIKAYAASREGMVTEINKFEDFFIFALSSKNYDYEGVTIKLTDDMRLTDQKVKDMLAKYDVTHLTIGTKDRPFKGTFDGQHHTIEGLVYDPGIIKDPNSGLFSFTDGATIKNLTLKDSSIECVYQGGNIVGHAKNTRLENLTVLNSKLKISPANNVLSLITNLGFCGGGIVGIMENSIMYNCEISGTEVVNNSTSGVSGVGGEGLYMGGLVGWAEDSVIEYSRARSNYVNEGGNDVIKQSVVRNDYDIAVGALGGKSVYSGGIVGGVNTTDGGETKIIDCFSTADVSFYAANYVAVGSGIAGYAGGITGALRGNSHIERCHYAGNIHSKQYNAVLVIPIIQTDVNISGISNINNDASSVTNSYFKRSSSETKKDLSAVGTKDDTENYAAKSDEVYSDYTFWESKDYDLNGTKQRNSKYSNGHINKWVMDYDLGIPVHGDVMYATFNFPDSAKVTIEETALVNRNSSTEDAYQFAAQGIHPRGDRDIKIHVKPKDSDANDNVADYRFDGWHKKKINKNHADNINELECDASSLVSKDMDFTFPPENVDNTLFIANMKARAAFYEVDGSLIEEGYYKYEEPLKDVTPKNTPDKSMFYGWTTVKNQETGGGYPAITSKELEELQNQKAIYKAGDPVEKAMKLYPIFKNDLANIQTEFEGHELDGLDQKTKRDKVGETSVGYDDKGAYINVTGAEADGAFPDGYRFLGWFKQDKNDKTKEICVSKDQKYYVKDASEPVTYIARLEYRTQYYVSLKQTDETGYNFRKFYTEWVKYKDQFNEAYANEILPKDYDHKFNHWANFGTANGDRCQDKSHAIKDKTEITEPMDFYAHWYKLAGSDRIAAISDFPNAAKLTMEDPLVGRMRFKAEPYPGYEFKFWAEERKKGTSVTLETQWKSPIGESYWKPSHDHFSTEDYLAEAHLTANIIFNKLDEKDNKTVSRTYESNLFQEAATTIKYKFPITGAPIEEAEYTTTEDVSPADSEMKHPGKDYEFLGWIQAKSQGSKNGIEKNGYEWNKIYDVEGDKYCTSKAENAIAYLLDKDAKVIETMDLYPVYTKYNIETTTNIHEVGDLPAKVGYPDKPTYTLTNTGKGVSTATLTVKSDKDIIVEGDEAKYKLVGMKCIKSDGSETNIWNEGQLGSDGNYTFNISVNAGETYKFVAIYSPVVVIYHIDDNKTSHVIKNINSQLGKTPDVISPIGASSVMVAWVKDKPSGGLWYHSCNSLKDFESGNFNVVTDKTLVKQSMELYPVFVNSSVKVQSNIDSKIKEDGIDVNTIRYIENKDNNYSIVANEYKGHVFKGWYTGYESDANPGTLVSEDATYGLTKDQMLKETKTYTAVYKQAIDITYHDFRGRPLYTAKTTKDENRTFVVKDNATNQEIPIDVDAFALIQNKIHQQEESRGTSIKFVEWKLESKDANGKYIYEGWNDFKDREITKDVNLYPLAYEVAFYTPEDVSASQKDEVYRGMQYSVNQENGEKRINALFAAEYESSKLKITTNKLTWERSEQNPDGATVAEGISGIHTDVYMKGMPDKDNNPTYVRASDGTVDTDNSGIAIHKILGSLMIKKEYADKAAVNDTIILKLQKVNKDGTPSGEAISLPMDVKDGAGQLKVRVPVGNYVVTEDLNWSWRDSLRSIITDGKDVTGAKKAEVKISVLGPSEITFSNGRENTKWFSDSSMKHNEFGKQNAGGNTK